MKHFTTCVISNILLSENVFEMTFSWESDAPAPLPGQFCTIRASKNTTPLLRRPFAFSAFDPIKKSASIIFKKLGIATEILAAKAAGDSFDIIGPLGNSFTECQQTSKKILIAGGMGFGPVYFWKQYLKRQKISSTMVLGSRTKAQLPDIVRGNDENIFLCTEDGSAGFKGTAVDYLASLPNDRFSETTLFCCGPFGMLKACAQFASANNIECYVSLEQIMACGVGACMGCAVKVQGNQSYARVCSDGPIFNSKMMTWI
jgi:dihydroorotate dehydrogenase electron transfer subunit